MKKIYFYILVGLFFMNIESLFALRCNGNLIKEGDTRDKVVEICGQPLETTSREEEILEKYTEGKEVSKFTQIELWLMEVSVYKKLRLLEFRDGVLLRIYPTDLSKNLRIDRNFCMKGISSQKIKLEDNGITVLRLCGNPDNRHKTKSYTHELSKNHLFTVYSRIIVEEWTYDFPQDKKMSIIELHNGIVTKVSLKKY